VALISIKRQPEMQILEDNEVFSWPIWSKGVSRFPWHYETRETCFFLSGEVIVTPENGAPVKMGKGDLVSFPAGMTCTWEIIEAVNKHYLFE